MRCSPLAVVAGLVVATAAPGADRNHVTSRGVVIALPAIAEMDCAAMKAKLDEIDQTGYRDAAPKPSEPADMLLFNYENVLSGSFFIRCLRLSAETAEPGAAFENGFKPDSGP